MNYSEFVKVFMDTMKQHLGEEYQMKTELISKNNGVKLLALTIKHKEKNIAPVVYLEPLYMSYQKGSALETIIKMVLGQMEKECALSEEAAKKISSLDTASDRIAYRLVSKAENKELLADVPWTEWNDLAIIYYLHLGTSADKQITTIIHNHQARAWNVTADELFEIAKENTPKICPSTMGCLEHLLFGWNEDEGEIVHENTRIPTLYVLSNENGINGAVCMLYDNVLKEFAEKMGSDLLILPSSIHEVLVLKYDEDMNVETYKDMVRSVNENDVPKEDILSNSVYVYTRHDDTIREM